MSRPAEPADPHQHPRPRRRGGRRARRRWRTLLAAVAAAGRGDAINAAAWWQQDTIGGRATGDPPAAAGRVLAGLHDGDPQMIDTLPGAAVDDTRLRRLYEDSTTSGDPPWHTLHNHHREQLLHTYLDAFYTTIQDAVASHCRQALHPTDPDPHSGPRPPPPTGVGAG
jgi:hypothetical protein